MISDEGDHVYPIIVTEGKLLCTAAISLIINDAVTEVLTLDFSESFNYHVACTGKLFMFRYI